MSNIIDNRRIITNLRRAVGKYEMIEKGDRIAVGLSGGKDSMALLAALNEIKKYDCFDFELVGLSIRISSDKEAYRPVSEYCNSINIEYHLIDTDIYEIVFCERKEKNPCSLCSKLRRGALINAAKEYMCNIIALGHTEDDVCETVLMNQFLTGSFSCFSPVTLYDDIGIKLIRPFIYVKEKEIIDFNRKNDIINIENNCPADENTEREHFKTLLEHEEMRHKGTFDRILNSVESSNYDTWKN